MEAGLNRILMYGGPYAPWDHYPKTLRFDEVQNPMKVIIDFFSAAWPDGQRKDLRTWRHYVVSDEVYRDDKFGPSTLIFIYSLNVRLIEAMYLLQFARRVRWSEPEELTNEQLAEERESLQFFPDNLSDQELRNPKLVIESCFNKISPQQYRDYLHEWLDAALSTTGIDETITAGEVIEVYDNLLKLYSAAWLICQRDNNPATENNVGQENANRKTATPVQVANSIQGINPNPGKAELMGLKEIGDLILKLFPRLEMIIHLGTHSIPFTFYLLILIPESEKTPEHEISNRIEDNCKPLANVLALAHKSSSAVSGISAGQRFWATAIVAGNVVYRSVTLDLPPVQFISNEVKIERAKYHWQRWGLQGKAFLDGAIRYHAEGNYRLAAFLLHQTTESTLKAIIQAVLGYRVQMHNLSRLLRLSLLFTDELKNAFELDTIAGSQVFNLLQQAYSQSRYNNAFDPDAPSIEILVQRVKKFFDTTERIYQQFTGNKE
jgi:HEPN domain-containing protein